MERLFWSLSKLVFGGAPYTKATASFVAGKEGIMCYFVCHRVVEKFDLPLTSPLTLFSSLIVLNFILLRGEFLWEFIYIPPNTVR